MRGIYVYGQVSDWSAITVLVAREESREQIHEEDNINDSLNGLEQCGFSEANLCQPKKNLDRFSGKAAVPQDLFEWA